MTKAVKRSCKIALTGPVEVHYLNISDKIEAVHPQTLACHHGSVKAVKGGTYLQALPPDSGS
ncbi:hypothetical protein AB0I82_03405 [Streptomyces sp. NPDC050315]|uniref:hypothetical protein n=1 Tax=Streptomyces sp. NPDC050315 TaxID=3155039 RepID=UPI00342E772F